MADLTLRRRHRIRAKEVRRLNDAFDEALGVRPFDTEAVDRAETGEYDVIIQDGKIVAFLLPTEGGGERPILTVRGLLKHRPERGHVTVDMGAVPYVNNGADVMAPGIVDAHGDVQPGDLVWVRDERNKQPLAIGEALLTGPEMVESGKGKAVKTLHYVGDEIWNLEV